LSLRLCAVQALLESISSGALQSDLELMRRSSGPRCPAETQSAKQWLQRTEAACARSLCCVQRVARDDQHDECADRVSMLIRTRYSAHKRTGQMHFICVCIGRFVLNSPSELIAAKYLGEIALRRAEPIPPEQPPLCADIFFVAPARKRLDVVCSTESHARAFAPVTRWATLGRGSRRWQRQQ
jgi:hypothetical protein